MMEQDARKRASIVSPDEVNLPIFLTLFSSTIPEFILMNYEYSRQH